MSKNTAYEEAQAFIPAQTQRMRVRGFNSLVQHELGVTGYDAIIANHWQNDSTHRFNVDLALFDAHAQNRVQAFLARDIEECYVHWLLLELAAREVIEEGSYIIEVSW